MNGPQQAVDTLAFKFGRFSRRQLQLITWWVPSSPYADMEGVIAEGAIRSGKTIGGIIGFILWTLFAFHYQGRSGNFIVAGKTMGALKRNVLGPMFKILRALGIPYVYNRSSEDPHITIGSGLVRYYLFAGNNESSADVLQGFTASGALVDEVPLMPESFIDQVFARCSEAGALVWMMLNPKGPFHWFRTKYVLKAKKKKLLRLHFTLDDNPNLDQDRRAFLERMFSGSFYQRYILGLWALAEGLIYPMFSRARHGIQRSELPRRFRAYAVSVDYGSTNPTVFLGWGYGGAVTPTANEVDGEAPAVMLGLYHFAPSTTTEEDVSAAATAEEEAKLIQNQTKGDKTDAQLGNDFDAFFRRVIPPDVPKRDVPVAVDPSAKSFKTELLQRGYRVVSADNTVEDGIREVRTLLAMDEPAIRYVVGREMTPMEKEMGTYSWDPKAQARGEDAPLKVHDHAPDAIRYFCRTIYMPVRNRHRARTRRSETPTTRQRTW